MEGGGLENGPNMEYCGWKYIGIYKYMVDSVIITGGLRGRYISMYKVYGHIQ